MNHTGFVLNKKSDTLINLLTFRPRTLLLLEWSYHTRLLNSHEVYTETSTSSHNPCHQNTATTYSQTNCNDNCQIYGKKNKRSRKQQFQSISNANPLFLGTHLHSTSKIQATLDYNDIYSTKIIHIWNILNSQVEL